MAAAAHNPELAAKMGIPQSVAKEFNAADVGNALLRHRRKGGNALKRRANDHDGRDGD
jgi:hypothetical protein